MITQESILAGLKKIGPCRPGELADHLEVEHTAIGYHLKKLLDAGTIKATGKATARRVGLPDQQFTEAEAPPQQRRAPKKGKSKKAKKKARKTPAAPPARTAERFIPTVDADSRLCIINGADPVIYSEEHTAKIAELLFQHYKA